MQISKGYKLSESDLNVTDKTFYVDLLLNMKVNVDVFDY